MRLLICLCVSLIVITALASAQEAQKPLPVYVYLFAHYEDHINLELSEWRIKEVMRILSEAQRAHPKLVAAVGEFYGADSEIFQQRNKESGIVGLIRRCMSEGWYDVGYHGAHEPTYATTSQAVRSMAGKSWQEIYTATRALYTAYRDLKTGELNPPLPQRGRGDGGEGASRKGGVARMQEVFDFATVLSGVADVMNPPGMLALNDLTGCRVHFGFTDHGPAMFNRDYVPAVLEIREAVSPTPETSPDVFWFMGSLVTSSHPVSQEVGVISSELPPNVVAAKLQRLDRTRVAVPHVIYGAKFIYARASPTEYAYGGLERIPPNARAIRQSRGDDFRLPPELIFSEAERNAKIENFRQNLDWLLTRYFPANPGSRFVGNRLLVNLTVPYAGESVTLAELDRAVESLLRGWTDRPPNFVSTGKRYLTLAQTFKLLAIALKAAQERHGVRSLPTTLQTDMTYGPIGVWSEVVHADEADVDAQAVIAAAARINFGAEREQGSSEPPSNRVPLNVTAGGKTMHAAQFLRLIGEAYQSLRAGKTPGVLRVRPSNILPPMALPWQRAHRAYADTPAAYGYLQLWTVKPTQFKEAMSEKPKAESRNEATGDARTLIQFRMNVNHFADEAEARENCRMLRRHLDLFKQAGVKASYWFTGLAAEQVQRLDPEFIRLLNEAGMPVAHHGANRPPSPQPIHRVKGENWQDDVRAILDYESHALDPRTGALDKTRVGGLKRMQEMFSNRVQATGRFFQASILYVTKQFGCRAMVGLKDNTGGSTNAAWFLGVKGMPDARSIGPEMLKAAATGQFDPSRFIENFVSERETRNAKRETEVQSLAVLIHDTDFLSGPPALRQRLWETYERLVRWAAKHPRLKVVTFEEILDRIADDRTKTVSRAALLKAAEIVSASPTAPPDYVDLSGDYLSLADTFQAFAQSLRAFAETGKLPESVKTMDLLGPTEAHRSGLPVVMAAVPLPKVTGEEVVAAAKQVCAEMTDRIPAQVSVGNLKLNPAEFLFAMAQTVTAITQTGKPAPLSLHAIEQLPRGVRENKLADPLTKLQFWTFKPERWEAARERQSREKEEGRP